MAKKAVKTKKAAPKKAAAKKPKTVPNLDGLDDHTVIITFKKVCKEPLRDHKRPEFIRRIREVYMQKGIIEEGQNLPAVIKRPKGKQKFQTVNWTFNYEFNEKEIIQKAERLADARIECNKIEEEKKTVMSDFKAKIDTRQAEINMLAGHIQNGFEKITKACQMTKDFDKGLKYYFYEGKKVGEEKLTQHDYQLQADFEEGKRKQ